MIDNTFRIGNVGVMGHNGFVYLVDTLEGTGESCSGTACSLQFSKFSLDLLFLCFLLFSRWKRKSLVDALIVLFFDEPGKRCPSQSYTDKDDFLQKHIHQHRLLEQVISYIPDVALLSQFYWDSDSVPWFFRSLSFSKRTYTLKQKRKCNFLRSLNSFTST